MANADSKVMGYFAYSSPQAVVCSGKACIDSGSETAMRRSLAQMEAGGKQTIRKTRFGEIMQGLSLGAAYAFDEESYGRFSERRIRAYDGQRVSIAYAHPEKHTRPTFTLDAEDFVLRLLSHVPEKGTHCARVYGLYHSACRDKLNQARSRLGQPPYEAEAEPPDTHELLHRMFPDFTGDLCPKCHARLVTVAVIRPGHSPPWRKAA